MRNLRHQSKKENLVFKSGPQIINFKNQEEPVVEDNLKEQEAEFYLLTNFRNINLKNRLIELLNDSFLLRRESIKKSEFGFLETINKYKYFENKDLVNLIPLLNYLFLSNYKCDILRFYVNF